MESEEHIEEIMAEEEEITPGFLDKVALSYESGLQLIISYGWHIVIVAIILIYLYKKYKSLLDQYILPNRGSVQSTVNQSPDEILARQEAMEAARLRMQEKLNRQVEEELKKKKEREEQMRKQKIEEWDKFQSGGSFRSRNRLGNATDDSCAASSSTKKSAKDNKNDRSLRGEFNPLTGSGFGSSYRPSRRGMSGGG